MIVHSSDGAHGGYDKCSWCLYVVMMPIVVMMPTEVMMPIVVTTLMDYKTPSLSACFAVIALLQ